jgi:hypothetical protein
MKHADSQRSAAFENDDCPFCDRVDEHQHELMHIRRRELLHLLHGAVPLSYYPRRKDGRTQSA